MSNSWDRHYGTHANTGSQEGGGADHLPLSSYILTLIPLIKVISPIYSMDTCFISRAVGVGDCRYFLIIFWTSWGKGVFARMDFSSVGCSTIAN